MTYRQIVFDIDGTLIDTEKATLHSLQETVRRLQQRTVTLSDLKFAMHLPGRETLRQLGIGDIEPAMHVWGEYFFQYASSIRLFGGVRELLEALKERHFILGMITSQTREEFRQVFPSSMAHFFTTVICADDCVHPKPDPEPMERYRRESGAEKEEILYIGDSASDMQCAAAAGVDGGLALWGGRSPRHIKATCYFNQPEDVLSLVTQRAAIQAHQPWLGWAMELQALGQAGLAYSKDRFDRERFERIRDIAAEMMSLKTGISKDHVKDLFCSETGYQTPKLDTRAAIFEQHKILLVQERSGTWSLPGGWVDVDQSVRSNTVKEVREEAGLDVAALRVIAVQDRNAHNYPVYAYGVCKIFVQCAIIGGRFRENCETIASRFFGLDELPPLSEEKNTAEQIRMCFRAYREKDWQTQFD